ncbi:hypothetical protein K458DRAFT_256512, partial [Lentithecium fluviatile CBS 122367]
SSAVATPTSTACATVKFDTFLQDTKDIACAVGSTSGIPSNYGDILKDCCKTAPVESYENACALYCLSVDQSVADLQKCFQEGGVSPQLIFCSGNSTATATGKPSGTSSSSGSSGSGSGSPSGTSGTSGTASGSGSPGAAAVLGAPTQGISKAGMGMAAMIVVSAIFGALL